MTAPRPTDLDLRLVRYFVAVAEHGSMGKAAESLLISQPSLSRHLQHLESQLGVELLTRSPRGTRLTPAGRAFLERAHELLAAAERAITGAHRAAAAESVVIGHAGNLAPTRAVTELRRHHPDARIRTRAVAADRVRDGLLAGRLDAAVVRMPVRDDALQRQHLYDEDRVLVMPTGHPLALKPSVALADFADEPLVRSPHTPYDAWWRIDPRPDGRPAPDGPVAHELGDKFELVAAGTALLVMPAGTANTGFRADLTQPLITDIPPTPVVLVTRPGDTRPIILEFAQLAAELLSPQ